MFKRWVVGSLSYQFGMVASINIGCIVSGNHGDLLPVVVNPDGTVQTKRRKRRNVKGRVIEARGEKRWIVAFENGEIKECSSSSLKVENDPRYNNHNLTTMLAGELLRRGTEAVAAREEENFPNEQEEAAEGLRLQEEQVTEQIADIITEQLAEQLPEQISEQLAEQLPEEFNGENLALDNNVNADSPSQNTRSRAPIRDPENDWLNLSDNESDEDEDDDAVQEEENDLNRGVETMLEDDIVEGLGDDAGFDVVEEVDFDEHQRRRNEAMLKRKQLIDRNWSVVSKKGNQHVIWIAVEDSSPQECLHEYSKLGVRDVDWKQFAKLSDELKKKARKKHEGSYKQSASKVTPYFDLFLALWPGSWEKQLLQLNTEINKDYINKTKNKPNVRYVKPVSPNEFFKFIGLIVVAGAVGKGGNQIFEKEEDNWKQGFQKVTAPCDFSKYMSLRRFEDIKCYFPMAFADLSKSDSLNVANYDPWYMISNFVKLFNENRYLKVAASNVKLLDETMSAWRPRKSKLGGLPNISFILRKPEPLGTEFKTGCCSETGIMLWMEIQRGKTEMPRWSEGFREFGATASCTIRAADHMANGGQRLTDERSNLFYGDSWFASVKTADQLKELGHDFVGPVKTSHALFPKEQLEKQLKDWPGGTHLVLEGNSPNGNALLAIGYKYNASKVLSFIATKNAGTTKPGIPYRARFVDDFQNLLSRPVERPTVISNYFQKSNGIDKHNQARQFELRLEKHWRCKNVWFRLMTTMIGIVVTDCWKAYKFSYLSKKNNKEISIRDFADLLSYELINNFKTSNEDESVIENLSPLEKRPAAKNTSGENQESSQASTVPRQPPRTKRSLLLSPAASACVSVGENVSPLTSLTGNDAKKLKIESLWVELFRLHPLKKLDEHEKSGRYKRRHCLQCRQKTRHYCGTCNTFCCPPYVQGDGDERLCLRKHIIEFHPMYARQLKVDD